MADIYLWGSTPSQTLRSVASPIVRKLGEDRPTADEMRLPTAGPMNRNCSGSCAGAPPPPRRCANTGVIRSAVPSSARIQLARRAWIVCMVRPLEMESLAVYMISRSRVLQNRIDSMRPPEPEIALLLDLLDEAFDKKSWHGPNLAGSLRGVSPAMAAWRPAPGAHNIWEYALHAAYWKYVVRRRLTGEKRGSFVLPGSNFFARPVEMTNAAWKDDRAILVEQHQDLRRAVMELDPKMREDRKRWRAILHLVRGAAAHDLYHAGQIRLLRRLCS